MTPLLSTSSLSYVSSPGTSPTSSTSSSTSSSASQSIPLEPRSHAAPVPVRWKFTDSVSKSKVLKPILDEKGAAGFGGDLENANRLLDYDFFMKYVRAPSFNPQTQKTDGPKCLRAITTTLSMAAELLYQFETYTRIVIELIVNDLIKHPEAQLPHMQRLLDPVQAELRQTFYKVDQVPALFRKIWVHPPEMVSVQGHVETGYKLFTPTVVVGTDTAIFDTLARFRLQNKDGIPLYFIDKAAKMDVVAEERDLPLLKEEFEKSKAIIKNIRENIPQSYMVFDWIKRVYKLSLLDRALPIPPEAQVDDDVLTFVTLEAFFQKRIDLLERNAAVCWIFIGQQLQDIEESAKQLRGQLGACSVKYIFEREFLQKEKGIDISFAL